MALEHYDQRQPDDRAVDDARDLARSQVGFDDTEHRNESHHTVFCPVMRRALILPFLLACVLLAPAAAHARPVYGMGDQNPISYVDPKLKSLKKVKVARLALSWDWYKTWSTRSQTDNWMGAVKAAHLRPLISFNRSWRSSSGRRKIPNLSQYKKGFKLFRQTYPYVRDFTAWNEPNAPEQPFYKKPAKAATFFNALRSACKKCTIVAADINDSKNMVPWLRTYKRKVHKAKVWGLHNYKDTSSRNTRGTTRVFVNMVRGQVWLTETGGLINRGGLKGQAKSVKRVFTLTHQIKRIKRVYFYQWRGVRKSHWDSAFLSPTGKKRPAYFALKRKLR
jgi:hypothetical protein